MRRFAAFCTSVLLLTAATSTHAQDAPAAAAFGVLNKHCGKCHGKVNPQSGLNVLDHRSLLDADYYVAAGKPAESELFNRVSSKDADTVMPPSGAILEADQAIIRKWIESGADEFPAGVVNPRPRITTVDVFTAMESDLRQFPEEDRGDLRYFTIHHLHNNPTVADGDLTVFRGALSKLMNSLSWEPAIILPVPVDKFQTVFRVNLAEIGWDRDRLWHSILTQYPYGLNHSHSPDQRLRAAALSVYEMAGTPIPVVRADWFVATASQPPLYHDMLRLPDGPGADRKLEEMLKVDVAHDFDKNRLARAGFAKSNVSEQNRLVDRHPAAYGAYWKSYDFKSSAGAGDLTTRPLGPVFEGDKRFDEFSRYAFEHDGGEIIFNLPNGLQAYLLIDAKGNRIDRGPIDVVFDSKQPLGNKEVINGISCMVCHARGMQPFQDDVRSGHGVSGFAEIKVERLYRPQTEMDRLLERDSQRFLEAFQEATVPFLPPEAEFKLTGKIVEPVGAIAIQFSKEMSFADVAAELNHPDPEFLKKQFATREFRKFGLGVLADDKVIKREKWESLDPYSLFQEVADQLDRGTPERVFP